MDVWQTLLLAIGGNAALLMAIAWLIRCFGSQLLAKDLEKFKANLAITTNTTSERLRHELQLHAHEHQIRFSKLHEHRAEVITNLYAELVEAQWMAQSFVSPVEFSGEPSKAEKYVSAMNKFADFYREFDRQRIFLPESICIQLDAFFQGMRARVIHFGVHTQTNEYANDETLKEKLKVWTEASEYFNQEVPATRKNLESELRVMLGGAVN